MLPLVLLRAFRCSHCQIRFYRFSLGDGLGRRARRKRQEESAATPGVEPPQKRLDFEQLIGEIREAEKQSGPSNPEDK